MSARAALSDVAQIASGRAHRPDPVLPGSGGPTGNAQLTAWLELTLLVLFVAELVTLLDVRGLITWHLAVGLLLTPPALAKTATTLWRFVRYYSGVAVYEQAGPPPLLLRLLGPLVILGTVGVLGTGVALVVVGPDADGHPMLTALGQQISALTLPQAAFLGWPSSPDCTSSSGSCPQCASPPPCRHPTGSACPASAAESACGWPPP